MTNSSPQAPSTLVLAIVGVFFSATSVTGQHAPVDLDKIASDWRARQNRIHSIRYEALGRTVVPKGAYLDYPDITPNSGDVPKEDLSFEAKLGLTLDLKNNRVRKDAHEYKFYIEKATFVPIHQVSIYDGSVTKSYRPKDINTSEHLKPGKLDPDLTVIAQDLPGSVSFDAGDWPLLMAHGIVPSMRSQLDARRLVVPPDVKKLEFRSKGSIGDRECVVLREPPTGGQGGSFCEYWIDPAQDSAIVRVATHSDGAITTVVDVHYQPTASGWLPGGWSTTYYSEHRPGQIFRSDTLTVSARTIDPLLTDADFDIPRTPGMIIRDVKAQKKYRVGSDGHTLVDITGLTEADLAARRPWIAWLLTAILVLGLTGGILATWRRRRTRRKQGIS